MKRRTRLSPAGRLALTRRFVRMHRDAHAIERTTIVDRVIGLWLLAMVPVAVIGDGALGDGGRGDIGLGGGMLAFGMLAGAALLLVPAARVGLARVFERTPTAAGIVRAWYPFVVVPLLYKLVPTLHTAIHGGDFFDARVMAWEAALFGGQPSRTFAVAVPSLPFSELLHFGYLTYFVLVWGPALWFYLRGRMPAFEQATAAFAITSLVCFAVFVWFPVQGPRYLFPAPTGGGIEQGPLYRLTHLILESGSSRGAAFPSGHVAVGLAQAVIVWRWAGARGCALVGVLALLLSAGAVYGGFHYLIDAVAGAVVGGVVAVGVIGRCGRREAPE